MKSSIATGVLAAAIIAAVSIPGAQAQQKPSLVGTWILASTDITNAQGKKVEPFGSHPLGSYMFDTSGHLTQMLMASRNVKKHHLIADYGTYSVTNGGKTLVFHIVGNNVSKLDGKDLRRQITLTKDEMKVDNSSPQGLERKSHVIAV